MTKQRFAKIISEISIELGELQSVQATSDLSIATIFRKVAQLDSKYHAIAFYSDNINGILCNLGSDAKNPTMLRFARSRLRKSLESKPDNKLLYDCANCTLSIAELSVPQRPKIPDLLATREFNEALRQFAQVEIDEFQHLERALTNSANILEKFGRNFEAILLYDRILSINPRFSMALGNKAIAIGYYIALSPKKYFRLMRTEAELLRRALTDPELRNIGGSSPKKAFAERLEQVELYLTSEGQMTEQHSQAKTGLTKYESFMLEYNLVLNYEFGNYYDKFSLRDSIFPIFVEETTAARYEKNGVMSERIYFAFQVFNQIVEVYTTSRYLFFQALTKSFRKQDKMVSFGYTFDYTIHGIKYGILKSIFCDLYNCLDKIAHLVSYYFGGVPPTPSSNIYLESLLSDEFAKIVVEKNSFQLLALRSLALDFEEGYQYHHLRKARNRITHSFLNINEGLGYSEKFRDYEISEDILIEDVHQLFVILKSAVLYFVSAVGQTTPDGRMLTLEAVLEKDIYF